MSAQLNKAFAIGVAAGFADVGAVSGELHRVEAHKSGFELHPVLKYAARAVIWMSGTNREEWVWVHRTHHEFADQPGDPHSPSQLGKWGTLKLIAKNALLYRKKVAELKASGQEPPADMRPDAVDRRVFNHKKAGIAASIVAHIAMNEAVGNPAYMAAVSFGVEKVFYLAAGGFVNGIGHSGKHPWKATFITGVPEPQEDGDLGADSQLVALMTLGEGNQRYHHQNPDDLYFGPANIKGVRRYLHDPTGAICEKMAETPLASYEPQGSKVA